MQPTPYIIIVTISCCFFCTLGKAQALRCPYGIIPDPVCRVRCPYGKVRLDCSGSDIVEVVRTLVDKDITNIDSLEMHDDEHFTSLTENLFRDLSIRRLDLSRNKISQVHPDALKGLVTLDTLNLVDNNLDSVPNLSHLPQLRHLALNGNNISLVSEGIFQKTTDLKIINLADNRICSLSPMVLNEIKRHLEYLDLSGNCFKSIPASTLRNFQKLAQLSFKNNSIDGVLPNLQFMNLPNLKRLDLSFNTINGTSPLTFMNVANLEWLNVSHNFIDDLESVKLQVFEKLQVVDLSRNRISRVPSFSFKDMRNLVSINLSKNRIQTIETYAFSSLPMLQVIDLQSNEVHFMQKDSFDGLSSLKTLNLANNSLKRIGTGVLSGMPELRYLNLHNNKLSEIDSWAFNTIQKTHLLDLGSNQIEILPGDVFKSLKDLFWLDLSKNRLKSLNSGTLTYKIANVLLQENPWDCSTENIGWLVDYLVDYGVRTFFTSQAPVTCSSPETMRGLLLKDLMIKRANETYIRSLAKTVAPQGPLTNQLAAGLPIDLSKITPEMIDYVSRGGVVPGVPQEAVQRLLQEYLKNKSGVGGATIPTNSVGSGTSNVIINGKTAPSDDRTKSFAGQLPPLGSLSPETIKHVLSGGTLPGLTAAQTEFVKNQYVQQFLGNSTNKASRGSNNLDFSQISPQSGSSPTKQLFSRNGSSKSAFSAGAIPPEILELILKKDPSLASEIFAKLISKPNANTIINNNSFAAAPGESRNLTPFWWLSAASQVPTYDINEIDLKADLLLTNYDHNQQNSASLGGWYTGIGLGTVGLITVLLAAVLCYRRKQRLALEREQDGAKFFGANFSTETVPDYPTTITTMTKNQLSSKKDLVDQPATAKNCPPPFDPSRSSPTELSSPDRSFSSTTTTTMNNNRRRPFFYVNNGGAEGGPHFRQNQPQFLQNLRRLGNGNAQPTTTTTNTNTTTAQNYHRYRPSPTSYDEEQSSNTINYPWSSSYGYGIAAAQPNSVAAPRS